VRHFEVLMRGWRWVAFFVSLATLGACARPQAAAPIVVSEVDTGIRVSGTGTAEEVPDTAVFEIGVEVRRAAVAEARAEAARAQSAVLDALQSGGIADEDIQTAQLVVGPEFEHTHEGRRLRGYIATNMVRVRTQALEELGAILDAAVSAAGDDARLHGLRFELDDPAAAEARAREQALRQARAKAEQIAGHLGVALGAPLAVDENGTARPPEPVAMRAEDAAVTPIERGMIEVRVDVRVRWAIRE
jgi:uncharacterized protein